MSKKKNKNILERLKDASQTGEKVLKHAKTAIRASVVAVTLGTAGYVYKQFHKSPEKIQQETQTQMAETKKIVEKAVEKDLGTNTTAKVIGKAAGKLSETSTSCGGALRKWVANKIQKTK